jgi:hypothetical protein
MEYILGIVFIVVVVYLVFKKPAATTTVTEDVKANEAPYKVDTPAEPPAAVQVAGLTVSVEGAGSVEIPEVKPVKAKRAPAAKKAPVAKKTTTRAKKAPATK